jgi:hypothetical protein
MNANLTENEKALMLAVVKNAAQYSEPLFHAEASCGNRMNVAVLNSLSKKGLVKKANDSNENYYEITADGMAVAKELGYLEIVRDYADWMYNVA